MAKLPQTDSVLDVASGRDPYLDSLLLHFMTENGLEYTIDPVKNASGEQIRFMVACRGGTFYSPCSDWMFFELLEADMSPELKEIYLEVWRRIMRLTRQFCPDRYLKRKILALCRYKFQMAMDACIVVPSRLMKRMITIFMTQSGIDDPYRDLKRKRTEAGDKVVKSDGWDRVLNDCPPMPEQCDRLDLARFELDFLEFKRLLAMSALEDYSSTEGYFTALGDPGREIESRSADFEPLRDLLCGDTVTPKKILYLPYRSSGIVFDLELIRALLRQGHSVVLALKEGFYFDAPSFWDVEGDPVLTERLHGARFLSEVNITKNELLREMREHSFVVISDGTRERFNPYRMSVALARAWKESDLVIAKGYGHYRRLFETEHSYTRDVFCYFRDADGRLRLEFRPKAEWVRSFSESYITAKADELIREMRHARAEGNTVMFYSGVIGSVPGQTSVAIDVMNTFVGYLRDRLDKVHIINPAEHFEEGMDADDLMFMWEKVQRSGYLGVWRFQSVADIDKSFELMGRKVPPVWAGKDATYSTGCTKEMNIALEVQREQRELQIIGPSPEKFFRRREYGVGKFCDVTIDGCRE